MNSVDSQIEQDLAWREAEMATLKLLLASSDKSALRHRAMLRACCAMLYAHYEGFCKFCWELFIDRVAREGHLRNELVQELAKRSMVAVFKKLRADTSDEMLWQFCDTDFRRRLGGTAEFDLEIDTESNLWPELSIRINRSLGLTCPSVTTYQADIKQLVGRRNEIAHGKKLEIADMAQFQKLEHSALIVMYELAISVAECLQRKSYLQSPIDRSLYSYLGYS